MNCKRCGERLTAKEEREYRDLQEYYHAAEITPLCKDCDRDEPLETIDQYSDADPGL